MALLLALMPVGVHAQVELGVRTGRAKGPGAPVVVGLAVKLPILPRVSVSGAVDEYESFRNCNQTWPDSFRWQYGGRTVQAGASLAVVETTNGYAEVTGSGGIFTRTGHLETSEPGVWSAGGDSGLCLSGHFWVEGGIRWLWIRDRAYHGFFATYPDMRATTMGISYRF